MNQAEQRWWDEFHQKWLTCYWHTKLLSEKEVHTAYKALCAFVDSALDHDAFKHSKR